MALPVETDKPDNTLSHKILNTTPESAGCAVTPMWLLLSLATWVGFGLPLEHGVVVLLGGTSFGFVLSSASWMGFLRLFKSGYAALPGRKRRDVKRLSVWAQQHESLLELSSDAATPMQLQVTPEKTPPPPGAELHARLAEKKRLDLLPCPMYLDVEPRPSGYGLRVRFQLPEAWQVLLSPCVDAHPQRLRDWLLCPPMRGDEDLEVRPFVWCMLIDRDDAALAEEDAALYVHGRELYEWAFDKAYWTHDTTRLNICKEVSLEALEEELSLCRTQATHLHRTLSLSHHPLPLQMLQESCVLLWPHGLPLYRRHQESVRLLLERERAAMIHRFWYILCCDSLDEEDTQDVLWQLLGSPSVECFRQLSEALPSDVRDRLLLLLREFLSERWLQVLSASLQPILGPLVPVESYRLYGTRNARLSFDVCLELLAKYEHKDAFVAFCQSLCLSQLPSELAQDQSSQDKERGIARTLRECAMLRWYRQAGDAIVPTLIVWLEEAKPALQCELLQTIQPLCIWGFDGAALEDTVLSMLRAEERFVPKEYLPVRVAAVWFVGATGTKRSLAVLEASSRRWDASIQGLAVDAAKKALERLHERHGPKNATVAALKGGLSTVEDTAEEGQLSLTDDEALEGQLSLSGAQRQKEKGPTP